MIIIKLGGSLITYKKDDCLPPYSNNELGITYRVREHLVRQVGSVLRCYKSEKILIVHGGGTHGHRTVQRWRKGVVKGKDPMMAWEVKWRMDQLSGTILKVLGEERVPAIQVPTSSIVLSNNGQIEEMDLRPVKRILDRGCVPVLKGDLVPDVDGGWSVVSGDTIILELCKRRGSQKEEISKVIMVMDVEGFIDPSSKKLVEMIDPDLFRSKADEWENALKKNEGDVSGGVWGKVLTCNDIASLGVESFMTGGDISSALSIILDGGRAGTWFPSRQEHGGRTEDRQ